jgi:hypothetical protein
MSEEKPIKPVPPEEALVILENAVRERLGDDWDDERDGWVVASKQPYMMRLTKGPTNMDFSVDLLGDVTIEEKSVVAGEDAARLVSWAFLLASLFIAFLIADIAGYI